MCNECHFRRRLLHKASNYRSSDKQKVFVGSYGGPTCSNGNNRDRSSDIPPPKQVGRLSAYPKPSFHGIASTFPLLLVSPLVSVVRVQLPLITESTRLSTDAELLTRANQNAIDKTHSIQRACSEYRSNESHIQHIDQLRRILRSDLRRTE